MKIQEKLRTWYLVSRRSLPWRETTDPYRIWVSEIILQQTRVVQGLDYYYRFIRTFPDIRTLAGADEEKVLKVWEGLGYYSRARNMHAAAKFIIDKLGGVFPDNYKDLLQLKGTGPYTAAAVSSLAFGEPRAVVDGNVHRVISRLYGIDEPPEGYGSSSEIVRKAAGLLDESDPGTHNQAVMELGAMICTPSRPDCQACPLNADCFAFIQDRIGEFPARPRAIKRRKRFFHYLVIRGPHGTWMNRRRNKDIWQGLYEFPMIETDREVTVADLMKSPDWTEILGSPVTPDKVSKTVKHILSHQEIHARFYHIPEQHTIGPDSFKPVEDGLLKDLPMPKLILNYLDKLSD
jgi:A/G-specific adenine glycosylase